ncbi:unnamed protein product, partial [Chrysoparadoxa australica]
GGGGGSSAKVEGAGKGKGKGKDGHKPLGKTSWKGKGRARDSDSSVLSSARNGQALSLGPSTTMTPQHAAKIRAGLLASDSELRQQYAGIVGAGLLTEEEFWEGRQGMLEAEHARVGASKQGISNQLLADVRGTVENNKQTFKLKAAQIHAIFVTYPAVLKAYQAKVPHELTEKEFWTKYFQSQYFHRNRGGAQSKSTISAADDMFSLYAAEEDAERQEKELSGRTAESLTGKIVTGTVDPMVDLTTQYGDYHHAEREEGEPNKAQQQADAQVVVAKFNRHAQMVMDPSIRAGHKGSASVRRP